MQNFLQWFFFLLCSRREEFRLATYYETRYQLNKKQKYENGKTLIYDMRESVKRGVLKIFFQRCSIFFHAGLIKIHGF